MKSGVCTTGGWDPGGKVQDCAALRKQRLPPTAPEDILIDHGIPWCSTGAPGGWTGFLVWLMKQGVRCHFSAIRHPETQGKVERFHQSLERARARRGQQQHWLTQPWLDRFRDEYNHLRSHEAQPEPPNQRANCKASADNTL
jgi:transposase InsO family protein